MIFIFLLILVLITVIVFAIGFQCGRASARDKHLDQYVNMQMLAAAEQDLNPAKALQLETAARKLYEARFSKSPLQGNS
jgi:hypothetical protein